MRAERAAPLIRCGTTPALNAATAPIRSGRRCPAAMAQAAPLEKPAATHRPATGPNRSSAHGITSSVTKRR